MVMLSVESYGDKVWLNPARVECFWEHVCPDRNDPKRTDVYFVGDAEDAEPLVVDLPPQVFAQQWNAAMNTSF